jgi:hypothetical protein
MPKIRILKSTICGRKFVKAGDVVEASEQDAHILVVMKKAELVAGAAPAPAAPGAEGPAKGRSKRVVEAAATVKKDADE